MKHLLKKNRNRTIVLAVSMVLIATVGALAEQAGVTQSKTVTSFTPPSNVAIDFQNAKPMPLPRAIKAPSAPAGEGSSLQKSGTPGFASGSPGTGQMTPETWTPPAPQKPNSDFDIETPHEYGTLLIPFTTSRVDLSGNTPSKLYPYRAAGKLYFKEGDSTYVCSASLIKKGVIVTAAHCVADFGKSTFYTGWTFVPALSGKNKPYGTWTAKEVWIKSSYYDGTDSCAESGIVCQNDVAVIALKPKSGKYPGTSTGWLGYAWNGYGFTSEGKSLINQLGYPQSHDSGIMMQRTDSQGFVDSTSSNNTVWGSRQTGGSSGGPELVNLGKGAVLDDTTYGSEADYNVVVGVTSWGYTSTAQKVQGASPFTSDNIVSLITSACNKYPNACTP